MSLLPPGDPNYTTDLTSRKEIYSLKAEPDDDFRLPPDEYADKYLNLRAHQLLIKNMFNPNTVPGRLQLTHAPGMGKTRVACAVAKEFTAIYKKLYNNLAAKMPPGYRSQLEVAKLTPSIIVLGFGGTKAAFLKELLGYPEFGFISVSEKEELARRRAASLQGFEQDIKSYKEYLTHLKKRITNKSRDGFYKFYGYDEFVNKIFIGGSAKLTEIEAETAAKIKAGEKITLEEVILANITDGTLSVDAGFLNSLNFSLIICDEIHNTYNMHMKNNRGVALQYVLDTVKNIWLLTMSATPTNNSPTEIVELMGYLSEKKFTKQDFFAGPRKLLPGAMDRIVEIMRGKVSFLQDNDPKYFPERIFMGERIKLPRAYESFPAGSDIPYLSFIPCKMSAYHQHTYEEYIRTRGDGSGDGSGTDTTADSTAAAEFSLDTPEDEASPNDYEPPSSHTIATDSYCIYDAVFPNPDSDEVGIFRSHDVRGKIASAPQEWRDANKITAKKYSSSNNVLTGDFLLPENLPKYWPKAATLVGYLDGIIGKGEKVLVYHDRVRTPGVIAIQEVLKMNGYLDEFADPIDSTRCVHCGARLGTHESGHEFVPARYITVHSEMDKQTLSASITKYNAPENNTGTQYMILIGSRIIKESYDFKCVIHEFIMSLPTNIPTMLQVFGRCVRRGSHIDLPPEKRKVHIYILITTAADGAADPISPEMYRYMDKILDYMVIQDIERAINSRAFDAGIHWSTIMPPSLRAQYFPAGATEPVAAIGNLYFEPADGIPEHSREDLKLTTFLAHKHFDDEIKLMRYIIKRLFIRQPAYTYDDLFAAVRRPPFGVEVNPRLFDEGNFVIALTGLISTNVTILSSAKQGEMTELAMVERLMDPNDRHIYIRGSKYVITAVGGYYVCVPVNEPLQSPLNVVHSEYNENIRDKERAMIHDLVMPNTMPIVDVETYLRPPRDAPAGLRVDLAKFIDEAKVAANYMAKRREYVENYKKRNFLLDYSTQFQASFTEECIENAGAEPVHQCVIELLASFGVLVTVGEITKYRDVVKQFSAGPPTGAETDPIGYMRAKSVRLYDRAAGQWFEISRISLNKHYTFKENDVIIGYLETGAENTKFKLRKPVQRIRADLAANAASRAESSSGVRITASDNRIVERGAVCSTKSKRDLLKIAGSLGISVKAIAAEKVHNICGLIFDKLSELEKKERDRDSAYKYFYGWWDEPVNVTGGLRL